MIDVHYWTTPNGHKITIFLEEAGLPYKLFPVNIGKGEQFKAEFLAVSPNNRIPAIVDHEPADGGKPISVFESGAILLYLADKTGKFIAKDLRGRTEPHRMAVLADGRIGPDGRPVQSFRQLRAGETPLRDRPLPQRGQPPLRRDEQAARRPLLSRRRIFDRRHGLLSVGRSLGAPGQNIADFPHLKRWLDAIAARDAVKRAYAKAKEVNPNPGGIRTAEERAILFGQTAQSIERMASRR